MFLKRAFVNDFMFKASKTNAVVPYKFKNRLLKYTLKKGYCEISNLVRDDYQKFPRQKNADFSDEAY